MSELIQAQASWDKRWRELFNAKYIDLGFRHSPAFRYAHRETEKELGKRPKAPKGPPTLFSVARDTLWQFVKTGGKMDFKLSKNIWKGTKAALVSAATLAAYAGIEGLVGSIDTKPELAAIGVPALLLPIGVALAAMAKNWVKVKKGIGR